MTSRDTSADITLDNANEGVMREEFEKLAKSKGQAVTVSAVLGNGTVIYHTRTTRRMSEAWNARQPEIDALNDKINTLLASVFNSSLTVGNLERENYRLKSEIERLRQELFKANCRLNANFSNSFEQPYQTPSAAMKDFSTAQKEEKDA